MLAFGLLALVATRAHARDVIEIASSVVDDDRVELDDVPAVEAIDRPERELEVGDGEADGWFAEPMYGLDVASSAFTELDATEWPRDLHRRSGRFGRFGQVELAVTWRRTWRVIVARIARDDSFWVVASWGL